MASNWILFHFGYLKTFFSRKSSEFISLFPNKTKKQEEQRHCDFVCTQIQKIFQRGRFRVKQGANASSLLFNWDSNSANMLRPFFMKTHKKSFEAHKRCLSCSKNTSQFGYSALGHMGALSSNIGLLLGNTQFTTDVTSKVREYSDSDSDM